MEPANAPLLSLSKLGYIRPGPEQQTRMRQNGKAPTGGLGGNRKDQPDLRDLTISLGRSDLYINLAKHVKMEDGHFLFEAILTDENGSRVIYVDREDIAACLRESMILGGEA